MWWYAGIVVPILLVVPGGRIGFDPLKQFPRVIHGNHPLQGRIAMGSPSASDICLPGKKNSPDHIRSTKKAAKEMSLAAFY